MLRKWFFGTFIVFTNGAFSYAADSIQRGKAEITKGIPGGSILTVAEIKKFLDEPANHKPLSPALPDNLKAGSSAVFVPEDNPLTLAKIELGRQLYFDKRLSVDSTVSCADCHSPATGYGANTQFGVGVRGQLGGRNSPVSLVRLRPKRSGRLPTRSKWETLTKLSSSS